MQEPASEEAGYGGHNELLEPMSSYDYEDAATAAASHPVEYESDVMARHDDILEPQAGSGGEPVEAVGAAEAQPNEATGAPDGHAGESRLSSLALSYTSCLFRVLRCTVALHGRG